MRQQHFETGDVVIATAESIPLIRHVGIVVRERDSINVFHNSATKINCVGGSIVADSLEQWLTERDLIDIYKSGLSLEEIGSGVHKMKYRTFDLLNFNCEHFVSSLGGNEPHSPQLQFWGIFTAFWALASR